MKVFRDRVAVDVLFNNAGVGARSVPWDTLNVDWQWALGVPLWVVIKTIAA